MTLATEPLAGAGTWIKAMVDGWARFSEDEEKLTRVFLSPEHKACAEAVMTAMRAAGMTARIDAIGNVVGRYAAAEPGARTLITGSHIDTVRDAGAYDGNLGVALPIACIADLDARGKRLPFAVEVVAFGDEEGVRFPTTLSGSRTIAGTIDPAVLSLRDAEGTSLADALAEFGCDPAAIAAEARKPEEVLAFVEVHIEQGPVLEAENRDIGVVTGVQHMSRHRVVIRGVEAHAGPTPMHLRKDPMMALAGFLPQLYALAEEHGPDGRVTFGFISAEPGSSNTVPGKLELTVDIRHPDAGQYADMVRAFGEHVDTSCEKLGLEFTRECFWEAPGVEFDPDCVQAVSDAVDLLGYSNRRIVSGAGHDACNVAAVAPTSMIFVPCEDGLSHNEAESITPAQAEAGANVLLHAMLARAGQGG